MSDVKVKHNDEDLDLDEHDGSINLDELLGDIKPNLVTPELDQVTSAQNNRKAKVIAEIMMDAMIKSLTDPVKKEIIHDGEIHAIRYVNIEPLINGPWATISLLLLNLSYGEQSTIIEAVYPKRLQLNAKSFAVVFTPELRQTTITIHQDEEVLERIDSANAGIAMILAMFDGTGYIPHADEIRQKRNEMGNLVHTMKERDKYKKDHKKSQDVAKGMDL